MTTIALDSKPKTLRELFRHRPLMYIGRTLDSEGLHFLIIEAVRLAVDPNAANDCTFLNVTIRQDGSMCLTDNGRGIPVSLFRLSEASKEGHPILELVTTRILTRHPDQEYYKQFGFLDYLGALLNVASIRFEVETTTGGKRYALVCGRGEIVEPLRVIGPTAERGTRILFKPDPEMFSDVTINAETTAQGLRELARKHPQVKFALTDERTGKTFSLKAMSKKF